MATPILRLASLAVGLVLIGCTPPADRAGLPDGISTAKALNVDHVRVPHVVTFMPGGAQPTPGAVDNLIAFLRRAGLRSGDRVYLEPAAGDRVATARIGNLLHALEGRGIGAQTLPPAQDLAGDQLRVLVDRYLVVLPPCPDWTRSPIDDHDNSPDSNFGCATVSNLGLMVADPRDLVMGREMGPADADPATLAVARYRAGQPKPLSSGGASTSSGGMSSSSGGGGASPQ